MTGHSPFATAKAIEEQVKRGITLMLPSEDAVFVAEELQQRFGLTYWQFALTAPTQPLFDSSSAPDYRPRENPGLSTGVTTARWMKLSSRFIRRHHRSAARQHGPPVDPSVTTRVVEFNDVPALEQALTHGDVACVLAEPALTNVGIVHPIPGYHHALRELTRKYGTLLIIDGTHTICAGPGGYTRAEKPRS